MYKMAQARTGVATIKPFSAWERLRSLAMATPRGPSGTDHKGQIEEKEGGEQRGRVPSLRKDFCPCALLATEVRLALMEMSAHDFIHSPAAVGVEHVMLRIN